MTQEDELYAQALDEVTTKEGLDKAIWARALVETKGNETAATATYISNRVKALLEELEHLQYLEMVKRSVTIAKAATLECPICKADDRVLDLNSRSDANFYLSDIGQVVKGVKYRVVFCFDCKNTFELLPYESGEIEYRNTRVPTWKEVNALYRDAKRVNSPAAVKLYKLYSNRDAEEGRVLNVFEFIVIGLVGMLSIIFFVSVILE